MLPALYQIPSDFLPNLFGVMQRRARILPTFDLATLQVVPDFLFGLVGLIHYRYANWKRAKTLQRG